MTNRSTNLKANMNQPFLLRPAGKDYLWGGNRLNDDFAKGISLCPLAETWELSTHVDGVSTVVSGENAGKSLSEVLKAHPDFLGTHPRTKDELPILIKLIDAQYDLSVQVHPNDEYAKRNENGQLGKTEMWYVLDAAPNSRVVYGFSNDVKKDELIKSLNEGTIEKYLQYVDIHKDDVFFIEAGTVHAICAGALIVEIQESSNLTYRMYDYNRLDKDKKTRELHIEKALKVAKLKASVEPRQPMRVLRYQKGFATELLCRCRYFQVERMLLNTEKQQKAISIEAGGNSFKALLCVEGCGTISCCEDAPLSFSRGDCIFIPANSVELELRGNATILSVCC